MGQAPGGLANSLGQTRREDLPAGDIDHPVLQRGGSAVEDQHRARHGATRGCAWIAVIATVFTMSCTVAPRERSLTGLRRPCSTGPMATAPALRCTALYVLLPVLRSGKMNTVARPATVLPGSLAAATPASTAASYWIGPSTESSGARSRTSPVAARTRSTAAPAPDPPVEYESIATRGSTPNRRAVSAEEIAMSASCSAVGSGFTAQ